MHKQRKTIESLLTSAKDTGLSVSEHQEMWKELRSYATFHTPVAVKKLSVASQYYSRFWYASMGAVAALVFVIGAGYSSQSSLPGEPLYAIKVGVIEPMVGLSYWEGKDQLHYQAKLMDRRLREMQALSDSKLLTEETVETLESQVEEHGEKISDLLTSENETITSETTLDVLSDVAVILRTQEHLEDVTVGSSRVSTFGKTKAGMNTLYDTEVGEFAEETPGAAVSYLSNMVDELDSALVEDVASSTNEAVEEYLEEVEEALTEGDVTQALQSAGEAQELVEFDKSLDDFSTYEEEYAD